MTNVFVKRILVVDDLKAMRSELIKILKDIGYVDFKECEDGKIAWEELYTQAQFGHPYDIVFSDINMPVMDGLTLLKNLRGTDVYKKTPIFMVSTESEKDIVIKAIIDGATDYILKPFTPETVRSKISKLFS